MVTRILLWEISQENGVVHIRDGPQPMPSHPGPPPLDGQTDDPSTPPGQDARQGLSSSAPRACSGNRFGHAVPSMLPPPFAKGGWSAHEPPSSHAQLEIAIAFGPVRLDDKCVRPHLRPDPVPPEPMVDEAQRHVRLNAHCQMQGNVHRLIPPEARLSDADAAHAVLSLYRGEPLR
jgi:hypothetical protein